VSSGVDAPDLGLLEARGGQGEQAGIALPGIRDFADVASSCKDSRSRLAPQRIPPPAASSLLTKTMTPPEILISSRLKTPASRQLGDGSRSCRTSG
jgi:hypothetical protein